MSPATGKRVSGRRPRSTKIAIRQKAFHPAQSGLKPGDGGTKRRRPAGADKIRKVCECGGGGLRRQRNLAGQSLFAMGGRLLRGRAMFLVRETALELLRAAAILGLCRFTSFIATNAGETARFWFVRAAGRGPRARTAARRNFPSGYRYLRRRWRPPRPARRRRAMSAPAARDRKSVV